MDIEIHFRGVAVFVANSSRAMEVLFPNALRKPPDGWENEEIFDPKDTPPEGRRRYSLMNLMRHADRSPAIPHFAGALIIGADGNSTYRNLSGRRVQIGDANGGTETSPDFHSRVPSLKYAIAAKPELTILDETERDNPDEVATRVLLDGGLLIPTEDAKGEWRFGPIEGTFAVETVWRFENLDAVQLDITRMGSPRFTEAPIILRKTGDNADRAYFYNFDRGLPTEDELTRPPQAKEDQVDNDLKWVYRLFKKEQSTWQDWLNHDEFPAPICTTPLSPVFTCFHVIWPF
jgi:hypothetical protein